MKTITLTLTTLLLFPLIAGCAWTLPDRTFVYVSPTGTSLTCARKGGGVSIDPSVATTLGDLIKHKATLVATQKQFENELETFARNVGLDFEDQSRKQIDIQINTLTVGNQNGGKSMTQADLEELRILNMRVKNQKDKIDALNEEIEKLRLLDAPNTKALIKECDEFLDFWGYPGYSGYEDESTNAETDESEKDGGNEV